MANFEILNPVFDGLMRRLETTDPNHADVFNNNFRQLIENDLALKQQVIDLELLETAGGTATAITLSKIRLEDGYSKSFIVKLDNNAAATTINGKPLYKPDTTTAPKIKVGNTVAVRYDQAGDCFFIKASTAEGNATPDKVLAGYIFSNEFDSGLIGTYNGRLINFPLSIQDAQPTPVRAGHIWVKSSALAAQITKIKILEALNEGETDGTLMFVVGDLALHSVSFGNTVDVTSGGYKYTSMSDTISSTADWDILSKSGDISSSYKINRPMVYSKVAGVLDIETTYFWDGTNWILLCEKDNYIVYSRYVFNTAANDGLVLAYKVGDSLVRQTSYDGGGRITTSRDGKYILCPNRKETSLTTTNATYFRLYKRSGDILVSYFSLTPVAGYYYKDSMMSADGQYLIVVWRSSGQNWTHLVQVYHNTGSTFEIVYTYSLPSSTNSTDYTIEIVVSINGEFIGIYYPAGVNYYSLALFFKSGSSYIYKNAVTIRNHGQAWGSQMQLSYDEKSLIIEGGTSSTNYYLDQYSIDYLGQTISTYTSIEAATGWNYLAPFSNAGGWIFYFKSDNSVYYARKIINNVITAYTVTAASLNGVTNQFATIRLNADSTRAYIWRGATIIDIYSVVVDDVLKKIIFTAIGTYTSAISLTSGGQGMQVIPS